MRFEIRLDIPLQVCILLTVPYGVWPIVRNWTQLYNKLSTISNWTPKEWELFYGTLGCSIMHTWASPFPGLWLAAGLRLDIFVHKYQLHFNTSTRSASLFDLQSWFTELGHILAGCVPQYVDQVVFILAPAAFGQNCMKWMPASQNPWDEHSSSLRGPSPQALTLPGGLGLLSGTWGMTFKRNANGS